MNGFDQIPVRGLETDAVLTHLDTLLDDHSAVSGHQTGSQPTLSSHIQLWLSINADRGHHAHGAS
jgi:hypothetical protein